jgi:hypothetical protein
VPGINIFNPSLTSQRDPAGNSVPWQQPIFGNR